jgi:peptidoglycan/xylan/chitin deacetylase (PgdA/CDA1 family)
VIRRSLCLLLATCLAGCASVPRSWSEQPSIAITIDDLPVHGPLPKSETPVSVARDVIAALKAGHVEAYGFINGQWTDREPATMQVLTDWRAAGLPLANHGWAHRHLNEMSVSEFESELVGNEPLLTRLAAGEDWRWFRYPFLDEGETPQKRAAARAVLAKHQYKIAAVTMDFSDWQWTGVYARCKDAADDAAIARLEQLYLDSARESIGYYRGLSRSVYGRDIPYVLLLHVSAFEARMLPRLLKLYRDQGFRFVSLPEAQADPAYADQLRPDLPAEPQGLENKATARGLRLPSRTDYAALVEPMCKPAVSAP